MKFVFAVVMLALAAGVQSSVIGHYSPGVSVVHSLGHGIALAPGAVAIQASHGWAHNHPSVAIQASNALAHNPPSVAIQATNALAHNPPSVAIQASNVLAHGHAGLVAPLAVAAPWGHGVGHIAAGPWGHGAISLTHGHVGHVVAAPVAIGLANGHGHGHDGVYVAKTRGAIHKAPLAGHINSATSVNVAPAPGTH